MTVVIFISNVYVTGTLSRWALVIARSDLVSSMCDGVPLLVENKRISMV